jgi:transcriptional regulator with XRE-family HTH domain
LASDNRYTTPMLITLRRGAVEKFRAELSQQELADRAGLARSTVNRIERGHAESVTFGTVNKIAVALGVDADMLVSFEREPRAKGKR